MKFTQVRSLPPAIDSDLEEHSPRIKKLCLSQLEAMILDDTIPARTRLEAIKEAAKWFHMEGQAAPVASRSVELPDSAPMTTAELLEATLSSLQGDPEE